MMISYQINRRNEAKAVASAYNLALQDTSNANKATLRIKHDPYNAKYTAIAARAAYLEKNKRQYSEAFRFYGQMIMCLNDTFGFAITDALEAIRKEGKSVWRHKVKQLANRALNDFTTKECTLNWQVIDKDIYFAVAENFHDGLSGLIKDIRLSANNVLQRSNIPHSEAVSYIIAARDCLYVARTVYNTLTDLLRVLIEEQLCGDFRYRCLDSVSKTWDELLSCFIGKQIEEAIEQDEKYRLACDAFFKKATSQENFDEATYAGILENKDKFTPEQLKEYEKLHRSKGIKD